MRRWYAAHKEQVLAQGRARYQKSTKAERRNHHLKYRYGITLVEQRKMLKRQGGHCALCGTRPIVKPVVDHNHKTQKVRAIVCNRCNRLIGLYETVNLSVGSLERYLHVFNLAH